jgi:hypothetical protein
MALRLLRKMRGRFRCLIAWMHGRQPDMRALLERAGGKVTQMGKLHAEETPFPCPCGCGYELIHVDFPAQLGWRAFTHIHTPPHVVRYHNQQGRIRRKKYLLKP